MARTLKTSEIIVRRSITVKLTSAFSEELGLLPEEMRTMLLDDLATSMIERMKVLRLISKMEAYPLECSE